MDHNRAISDIGRIGRVRRQEEIGVLGLKRLTGSHEDGAMLAAQITDLACLRLIGVAGRLLAAVVGVEMSACQLAIPSAGDEVLVDVVCCTRLAMAFQHFF